MWFYYTVKCPKDADRWQNQQYGMCAQQRLRSAWASAQSDQSLRCVLSGLLSTQGSEYSDQRCPGWSEYSLGAHAILLVLSCCGSNWKIFIPVHHYHACFSMGPTLKYIIWFAVYWLTYYFTPLDKRKCYANRPYLLFSELKPETHIYIFWHNGKSESRPLFLTDFRYFDKSFTVMFLE